MDESRGQREFEDLEGVDIGVVLAESDSESEVLARWGDQLGTYAQEQGYLDALRLRSDTEPPWPQFDNPMLRYLVERGGELAEHEGVERAIEWLAAHAWFEGAIAERSRVARMLVDDGS